MTQNEKSKIRAKVIKWVTRLFLILVAIIMLYPLAWNVVSSFKTSTEFLTDPFAWPQGFAWDNYARAYEKSNLAALCAISQILLIGFEINFPNK